MGMAKCSERWSLLVGFALSVSGCSPTVHTAPSVALPSAQQSAVASPAATITLPTVTVTQDPPDLERLAHLREHRTQSIPDYPIGPGDILEISVPAMPELKDRTVRVSSEGTVALSFVGVVHAQGMTEEELRDEIRHRLEEKYMHDPQVDLFVREYRSRQAAVIGAVKKPGIYNISSGAETILDLLSLAGGMTEDAAQRVLFIPAEPLEKDHAKEAAVPLPSQLAKPDAIPLLLKKVDPIVIDLQRLSLGGTQLYLSLPVRPGDVFIIPGSGEVLIDGWIERPGSYKLTPGLTVLGAVAAAGGPLFAADTRAVRVIRTEKEGKRVSFVTDLEKIKSGENRDVMLQEGDVIDLASSSSKLVPYSMFRFFTSVFHVGASAPLY